MSAAVWITLCSIIIFFLQSGFVCYESGLVQSRNVISVAIENLFSLSVGIAAFSGAGFLIMFGHLPSQKEEFAFYLAQIMFAVTSVTIFAGAMSERTKLKSLVIAAFVSAVVIYPVFGRLVWYGYFNDSKGLLEQLGFMDFAGASVVHMTAGFIALAGVIVVGKRTETRRGYSNIPMAVLGVFILWFGWFGFNGVMLSPEDPRIPLTIINVTLAGGCGVIGAVFANLIIKGRGHYFLSSFDGVLSALVAITALSAYVNPGAASLTGFIAGFMAYVTTLILKKTGIDDVVHVIPTHLAGGLTGCLCTAFLAGEEYLQCSSRLEQLGIQLLGVSVNGLWAFLTAYIMFRIISATIGLRVNPDEEKKGLNIVEFDDIYAWENYNRTASYESEIYEKNKLLRKQARLLAVTEEQEKERLAHDIHDGMGQSLSALKVVAGLTKLQAEAGDAEAAAETAGRTAELARTSISEMRGILNNLRPEALEREGLGSGIQHLVDTANAAGKVQCTLIISDEMPEFDRTVELNLYRAIQECLNNVLKHSEASECSVVFENNTRRGMYRFTISDNGKGFNPDEIESRGLGLSSMEDRINMLGGLFRIDSITGKGTQIIMEVPYQ
ncbi:MAG: histidine kinase [Lentihominibacter sp.]